jgi:hypothetical protein
MYGTSEIGVVLVNYPGAKAALMTSSAAAS